MMKNYRAMLNKKIQEGLTLLELMVVIAVIGIIATAFVASARVTYAQQLEDRSENFARDVKYVRNLASSRASYKFADETSTKFPEGGYGIVVQSTSDYYDVVAYKADGTSHEVIKHVPIESNIDLRVDVTSPAQYNFYMRFLDENDMTTNMTIRYDNKYVVKLGNFGCTGTCDRGVVAIAEVASDGNLLYNIAYSMTKEVSGGGATGGSSCFVAGTMITMADGSQKKIEEIVEGDKVLSKDKNLAMSATVLSLESPIREGYYVVRLENGQSLNMTDEHPIYSRGIGWEDWASIDPRATWHDAEIKTRALEADLQVFTLDGWVLVKAIDYVPGAVKTYNLKEVEGNVFFAEGVLVHNKTKPINVAPPEL